MSDDIRWQCTFHLVHFPLAPMGVLAPVSSHAGPSTPLDFFSDSNVIFSVIQEPMQNFKTVAPTLLGETAHFGFCPPKIGIFRGGGRNLFFIGIFIFL